MEARPSPLDPDLAAVFAALPGATAVFAADSPHFTVLAASDALLATTRRAPDAVIGRPLADAWPDPAHVFAQPTGLAELRATLDAAIRTGVPQHMSRHRCDVQRPDGVWEERYWDTVNTPVRGTDGAVRWLLHQTREVTAQVLAEAAATRAERAERRAEGILERMTDAHCVLDRDFTIVSVNAATERVLGRSRDTLLGRSHWVVFPASYDAPVGRAYRRVVQEGVEQHLTHHYTGEGYDFHLEVDAYPTDEGGVAVFWRDVTERVRAEAALKASEEKYRALFTEMDEAYAVVDVMADAAGRWTDFLFLEVNPAFMRHTGMPDPVGRTATQLLGTPNPRWAELCGRVSETGESIRLEESELTLGRTFDLNIFRLGGSGSRRVAVLFADISARKATEAVRRDSEERQAFLLELSDDFRAHPDEASVGRTCVEALARHMDVERCYISELSRELQRGIVGPEHCAPGFAPISGVHPYSGYPDATRNLEQGRPLVSTDVANDPALSATDRDSIGGGLGLAAIMSAPLYSGEGNSVWALTVGTCKARAWTADDLRLIQDVGERAWAAIQRARADAALRASEEQFRRAVQEAPIPVIMHAEDGEVLQVSRTWTELTGYTVEDVPTFHAWLTTAYGEGADAVRENVHALFSGTQHRMSADFPVRTRGGDLRHWSFSASAPGTLHDGRRFVVGMALDVTDRRRAQDALRASEARLAAVFEALPVGIGFTDTEGDLLLANTEMLRRYLPTQRMPSRDPERGARWRAWHPDGGPVEPRDFPGSRALRGESVLPGLEMLYQQDDGREVWTRVATVPLHGADGVVTGVACAITDIDALKRGTEALRTSEARYRTLVENVRDYAIFLLDPDGTVIEWTTGAERLLGYTPNEAVGQHFARFYAADDVAAGIPGAHLAQATGEGRGEWEGWRVRRDGTRFWANEIATAIHDADGRLLGFTKISRDLTERKAFEDALQQARESLEARVRERTAEVQSLFTRLVSAQEEERRRIARDIHDHVGQQMTALRMNLEALRARVQGTTWLEQQAQRTLRLAEELDHSIDFLTWQIRPAALDHLGLSATLQSLVTGWSERFATPAEFDVDGVDQVRLTRQVEVNLYRIAQEALHNVAKHAQATQVNVYLVQQSHSLVLLIEDNGRGFDPDRSPSPRSFGGMGLVSMRERATLVGGRLEIESAPGHGTSVYVRVPVETGAHHDR